MNNDNNINNDDSLVCDNGSSYSCDDLYDCCDCGGNDCGCGYCWSCNACESCLANDDN